MSLHFDKHCCVQCVWIIFNSLQSASRGHSQHSVQQTAHRHAWQLSMTKHWRASQSSEGASTKKKRRRSEREKKRNVKRRIRGKSGDDRHEERQAETAVKIKCLICLFLFTPINSTLVAIAIFDRGSKKIDEKLELTLLFSPGEKWTRACAIVVPIHSCCEVTLKSQHHLKNKKTVVLLAYIVNITAC